HVPFSLITWSPARAARRRSPSLPLELTTRFQVTSPTVLTWRVCAALGRSNTGGALCGIGYGLLAPWRRKNPTTRRAATGDRAREAGFLGTKAAGQRLVLRAPILRQDHGERRSDGPAGQQCREPHAPARNRGESHKPRHREERHHQDRGSRPLHQGSHHRFI